MTLSAGRTPHISKVKLVHGYKLVAVRRGTHSRCNNGTDPSLGKFVDGTQYLLHLARIEASPHRPNARRLIIMWVASAAPKRPLFHYSCAYQPPA